MNIDIPEDLKRALGRLAVERGVTEAEIVLEALRVFTAQAMPPRPRLPLLVSGKPDLSEEVDCALERFGRD